jgi:hypothetical protein
MASFLVLLTQPFSVRATAACCGYRIATRDSLKSTATKVTTTQLVVNSAALNSACRPDVRGLASAEVAQTSRCDCPRQGGRTGSRHSDLRAAALIVTAVAIESLLSTRHTAGGRAARGGHSPTWEAPAALRGLRPAPSRSRFGVYGAARLRHAGPPHPGKLERGRYCSRDERPSAVGCHCGAPAAFVAPASDRHGALRRAHTKGARCRSTGGRLLKVSRSVPRATIRLMRGDGVPDEGRRRDHGEDRGACASGAGSPFPPRRFTAG